MANKADKFYFENFAEAGLVCERAAHFLLDTLKNYNQETLPDALAAMHEIEHEGDTKKHELSSALARAFVTPIDREDLAAISENIDDVADCIEEVLQRFYVDGITSVLPEAIEFAEKIVECTKLMSGLLKQFQNFKKPQALHTAIIELGHTEEICDELYIKSLLAVRTHCTEVLDIIFWREIFDCLEACADACEHVGDCIETVVMKNT